MRFYVNFSSSYEYCYIDNIEISVFVEPPSDPRYLTMGSSIDLSAYAGQTVRISWQQDEDGSLESDDCLRFSFSADGGSTWSTNYLAFCDEGPSSSFSYTIPGQYLTNDFRMRFYLSNFGGSSEYCYIDNIQISVQEAPSPPGRYLTMSDSIGLSAYAGETVRISWQQHESGYLESDDCLRFAISSDGGSTWSSDITAFCDDIGSTPGTYTYTIPASYLTTSFRMRFYLSSFTSSSEYCYIDNIQISVQEVPSPPGRYLTMLNSIDLSAYAGETVDISWQQHESGELESDDCLRFAISNDGGSTWSSDITAFCNDIGSTPGTYTYTIPGSYLTTSFRMRFYLSSFTSSSEYCYMDNVEISVLVMPPSEPPGSYLTMSSSIDLSAYAGETVRISWQQDEGGYLESDDCLYFNFSADGGSTWSTDYLAFCNDDPTGSFTYTIPDQYLTNNFRMRFYLSGFTSSSEYCYIDNIEISAYVVPPYEPPGRYLTMLDNIPLDAYAGETVRISWQQDESGYLEDLDRLYFAFSANGGITWSADYEAFRNDDPPGTFTYTIPDQYLTNGFRLRFYLYGFDDDSNERCYIDNIEIAVFVAAAQEPPGRYLTMLNNIDLSGYAGQTLEISWEQDEDGDLEDSDRLYFAFSGDGGSTWSADIEAFRNDNPPGNFSYTIPVEYMTNSFRMRFYLYGFDEGGYYSAEYCYIDDITITAQLPLAETAKVNRVNFGSPGNMYEITTDQWQVEPTPDSGAPNSWSYSCFYDATDIVRAGLNPDNSGTFTLGHVLEGSGYTLYDPVTGNPSGETGYPLATPAACTSFGCTRYQWTYAGWSLLLIYSSPETKGHQLYLFDTFRYVGLDTRITFFITNFLAPDDTTGSHLTYFVGEGDNQKPNNDRLAVEVGQAKQIKRSR